MTQEVGYVRTKDKNEMLKFENFPVGSVLYLYQYHNCQAASRFQTYYVHQNDIVVEEWQPAKFW